MGTINQIKIIVEGVSIQGIVMPKGTIVRVLQPGEASSGKDIRIGVAKYLIFNKRAEAIADRESQDGPVSEEIED